MPDRAHGPALDDEEDDLGGMAEAGEDEEGPEEYLQGARADVVDDSKDCQADGHFGQTDSKYVENLANSG